MGRLTQAHAPEFERIRSLCYSGLDSAALREHVGDRLTRHLGLASYCFGATDPATAQPVHSVSVGLHPDAMQAFLTLVLETPSPWTSDRGCGVDAASPGSTTWSTTSTKTPMSSGCSGEQPRSRGPGGVLD